MLVPKLSESLASRIEVLTLWPFSQGEIKGSESQCHRATSGGDVRGLKVFAEAVGKRWLRGVVLYQDTEVIPFGSNLRSPPSLERI